MSILEWRNNIHESELLHHGKQYARLVPPVIYMLALWDMNFHWINSSKPLKFTTEVLFFFFFLYIQVNTDSVGP